jgi:predicted GIY-YIG superfamily endonuclease
MTTNVYILELLDNCYYVGRSKCVEKRLMDHMQGKGSSWTQLHKPC